jgi:hypothetical protein
MYCGYLIQLIPTDGIEDPQTVRPVHCEEGAEKLMGHTSW